jgi:transaldolase
MSYSRKNKLTLIQDVQQVYNSNKKEGTTTIHVYRTNIYPLYRISLATFYNYLSTPASKILKEMEKKREMQPSLF